MQRWNIDQVPVAFNNQTGRTYETKGATRVWVAGSDRGEADLKRMGTLHLLIQSAPVGTRQPKPLLIFRGKGIRIPARERENRHPDVDIMFQPKAYNGY